MKTKLTLIKPAPRKRNWLRALYIITKRKLRKLTDEKLIVILSAAVFLLQLFIILTALATPMHVSAQGSVKPASVTPRGLQVGDFVPDVTITNIINYKTPTTKISDFKGRLLIVNFCATWCGSCINSMPDIASLNRQFAGKAEILSITAEPGAKVASFYVKRPELAALKLPFVTGDTVLHQLFPHNMLPHLVWIGPDGKYLGSSGKDRLTQVGINKILKGELPGEKLDNVTWNKDLPLLVNNNGGNADSYLFRSVITGNLDGLPNKLQLVIDTVAKHTRFYAVNQKFQDLFKKAFRIPATTPSQQIIIDLEHPEKFFPPENTPWEQWREHYQWSYEVQYPGVDAEKLYPRMQFDLNQFFGLHTRVEKRKLPCLVLQFTGENKFMASSKPRSYNLDANDGKPKYINRMPLSFLVARLNLLHEEALVINETGYTKPVDLVLNADLKNLTALNNALSKYQLTLVPEARVVDVLLITDKKPLTNLN